MDSQDTLATLSDHVVVLNCNEKAGAVVDELLASSRNRSLQIVLVVQDEDTWKRNRDWHPKHSDRTDRLQVVSGNPGDGDTLDRVHVDRARAAIVLADPAHGALADARSTFIALAIEARAPAVQTVVELIDSSNRVHLERTRVDDVICEADIKEKLIAQTTVTPWVKNVFRHLLAAEEGTAQVYVTPLPPSLAGRTFRQLASAAIEARAPFTLLGVIYGQDADRGRGRAVLSPSARAEPGKDTPLGAEDRLVVIACTAPELEGVCRAGLARTTQEIKDIQWLGETDGADG